MGSRDCYIQEFGGPIYRKADWNHYPVCFGCRRFCVFLFYFDDCSKIKLIYPDAFMEGMILCAECVPTQADFQKAFPGERVYREDSILNNLEILDLLVWFSYNTPDFLKYARLDRLILTPNAMLVRDYKRLARQPLPQTEKIEALMRLFPEVHRFANRKYDGVNQLVDAVKAKYTEIRRHYARDEAAELQDHIDTVVNRTPKHTRSRPQRPPIEPVVDEDSRASDSSESVADLTMSSTANSVVDALRQFNGSDISDEADISSQSLTPSDAMHLSSQGTQPASSQERNVRSPAQSLQSNLSGGSAISSQSAASQEPAADAPSSQSLAHISSQSVADEPAASQEPASDAPSSQSLAHISSQSVADEPAASQESAADAPSSQSLAHISSQSVADDGAGISLSPEPPRAAPQPQSQAGGSQAISSEELPTSPPVRLSDGDTSSNSDRTRRKRRSVDSLASDDEAQAGPSRPKRTRANAPVNASPEEVAQNPTVRRLPRFPGG